MKIRFKLPIAVFVELAAEMSREKKASGKRVDWHQRYLEEGGELAMALHGKHPYGDTVDHQLAQLAAITILWLLKLGTKTVELSGEVDDGNASDSSGRK